MNLNPISRIFLIGLVLLFALSITWQTSNSQSLSMPAQAISLSGKWSGKIERILKVHKTVSGVDIDGTGTYIFEPRFIAGADHKIASGELGVSVRVFVTAMGITAADCQLNTVYKIVSGKVSAGSGGMPVFDFQFVPPGPITICGETSNVAGPFSFHLASSNVAGAQASGKKIEWSPDNMPLVVSAFTQGGMDFSFNDNWVLVNTSPLVNQVQGEVERIFLQGVPVKNRYTTQIDWNGNKPGKVVFALGDQTQEDAAPGASVQKVFDMGTLPGGKNQLKITAISQDGAPAESTPIDVIIAPQQAWVKAANFSESKRVPGGSAKNVIYQGKSTIPKQPIELPYFDISSIPLIGGKWGVPPFQLNINLLATSSGGSSEPAPMDGEVALYTGSKNPLANLKVKGESVTSLEESGLKIQKSQAQFTLLDKSFSKQVGIVSLVPGLSEAFNVPVVGNLLKALNSISSIEGTVTVNAKGTADIGVNSAQDSLMFTNGSITPGVKATIKAMLNFFDLASAWAGGEGSGNFTLQVAPQPKWTDCTFDFKVFAGYSLGSNYHNYPKTWNLLNCQGSAMSGGIALARYPIPSRQLASQAGQNRNLSLPEEIVQSLHSENGLDQTTLVKNASPQAMPALAAGPDNRMAFAWIEGASGKAAGQASHIMLRLFNGSTWADPITIAGDGIRVFSPSVAFDRYGRVLVAWAQARQVTAGSQPGFDTATAQSMEIVFAVVEPEKNTILRSKNLTQNNQLDFNPRLVRANDGTIWLSWIASAANALVSDAKQPNQLKVTRWDGGQWSALETATDQLAGTLTVRLAAYDAEKAFVVADIDKDGDLSTSADREIHVVDRRQGQWGKPIALTQNQLADYAPLAAYTSDGKTAVAWYEDRQLLGIIGEWTSTPMVWLKDASSMLLNGMFLSGNTGELMLVWPDASVQQGIAVARYQPDQPQWRAPEPLLTTQQVTSVSAAIDSQGNLVAGFAAFPAENISSGAQSPADLPASVDLKVVTRKQAFKPVVYQVEPAKPLPAETAGPIDQPAIELGSLPLIVLGFSVALLGIGAAAWLLIKFLKPGQH